MPKGYPNAKPFGGKGDHDGDGQPGGAAAPMAPFPPTPIEGTIAPERELPGEPVPVGGFALYGKEPAPDYAGGGLYKPKMVSMKLLKNYRPYGAFEIVGHTVEAVMRKDAAGREYEVEPETFIADQAMPSAMAGVGFESKLWAGTVIRMTAEEAKHCRSNAIAERTIDD